MDFADLSFKALVVSATLILIPLVSILVILSWQALFTFVGAMQCK